VLSAIDNIRFLSGGYNQRIHVWTSSRDDEPDSEGLKVFFKSGPVYSLAYIPEITTVLGASSQYLIVIDINKPMDVTYQVSRNVRHIHSSQLPNIVALEVSAIHSLKFVYSCLSR
jgi:hypothetical protein